MDSRSTPQSNMSVKRAYKNLKKNVVKVLLRSEEKSYSVLYKAGNFMP